MTRAIERQLAEDNNRYRRELLIRHVLHGLEQTIQIQGMKPDTLVDEVRAVFTDASVRYIAPLIEAVGILEAIIFASDGCMGHKNCIHSMEPWKQARALLQGKWEYDTGERRAWPDPPKVS